MSSRTSSSSGPSSSGTGPSSVPSMSSMSAIPSMSKPQNLSALAQITASASATYYVHPVHQPSLQLFICPPNTNVNLCGSRLYFVLINLIVNMNIPHHNLFLIICIVLVIILFLISATHAVLLSQSFQSPGVTILIESLWWAECRTRWRSGGAEITRHCLPPPPQLHICCSPTIYNQLIV